ncbi:MAG: bleomycin resistance protein [Acidobacteria bacterium]|nr:MAG: bleomycin resistance protein [Acidobacteriota bacterium]
MKPILTGIAPQFVVQDVVKTAEFYRDKLGFELLGYFADPPVYAMVRRDSAEIHFGKADSDKIQTNETVRRGLGTDAYIFVTDVNELYHEFKERGVEITEGPIKRIYECTEITIKDCNGFQLVFGE